MMMRRRLACCTRDGQISLDFDEQERIMRYDGLENCILKRQTHDIESITSTGDEAANELLDDGESSCSSSRVGFGSCSSKWLTVRRDKLDNSNEWETKEKPCCLFVSEERAYSSAQWSAVEAMKERFASLLLGEDVTGGAKGLTSASALSNAIVTLATTVFGELWKLEPLAEEKKRKWRTEMDWLLSPTNHMVELVPTKQNGANGQILEVMIPKSRLDIQMNLPALQKLDSMLIGTLDSMVSTEFWYAEGGSQKAEGARGKSRKKKWWLPTPRVPERGLSDLARKKLINQGRQVHQILKATRLINQTILLEMPVPTAIRDALPKSGKASLSDELYNALIEESTSAMEALNRLNLESQHVALEVINSLEAAAFSWREKIRHVEAGISGTSTTDSTMTPVRTSWAALTFIKDPRDDVERAELLQQRAEAIIQQLKTRHPNLPHTFLDAAKVQYGKDIGHSILEAYSRVLGNLAFNILCRIGDILREDINASNGNPNAVSDSVSSSSSSCFLEATWCSDSATSSTYSTRTSACDLELNSYNDTNMITSDTKASSSASVRL